MAGANHITVTITTREWRWWRIRGQLAILCFRLGVRIAGPIMDYVRINEAHD